MRLGGDNFPENQLTKFGLASVCACIAWRIGEGLGLLVYATER